MAVERPVKAMVPSQSLRRAVLAIAIALVAPPSPAQTAPPVITDRASYNAGSDVLVRLAVASGSVETGSTGPKAAVVIRYAGEPRPVATSALASSVANAYVKIWHIPESARTGRYEIALEPAGAVAIRSTSFTVYRKLVGIEEIALDKTFYTSGDLVGVTTKVRNLGARTLSGLRVEFSDRYWPWIGGPAARARASVVVLATNAKLAPGAEQSFRSSRAAVAPQVTEPTVHQYGVVVWDRDNQGVLAIAFSPLVIIHPVAGDGPQVYPSQFMFQRLNQVNVTAYRHFYPPAFDSAAIQFDHAHTMFPAGAQAGIKFTLQNPTSMAWHNLTLRARLRGPDGSATQEQTVAESLDLRPGGSAIEKSVTFELPSSPGHYRAEVEILQDSGPRLSTNYLELAVNPLPKSVLLFAAHEDDEGSWMGLIRAAAENHVPIRFVYFTSGDAGSCDLYYQHSCDSEQATRFGSIRMDEVRAALGHLGVPRDDIYFLGLPDGGSGMIWYDHLKTSDPFLDPLLGVDHAPYDGLVIPNLAYDRQSVVDAVKQLILKFRPEVVITAHPQQETHVDHVVANYFVTKALQDLRAAGAGVETIKVLVDRVYNPKEAPPTPYHYAGRSLYVSGETSALAQEAGWYHQSQGGNRAIGHLRDFDQLPRTVSCREILDWNEHAGWNEKRRE